MKVFVCLLIVYPFFSSVFSQNSVPGKSAASTGSVNERWDLQNNIWSYAHSKSVTANKAKIDFDAIDNWQGLGNYLSVSNDGKYFAYSLERGIGLSQKEKKIDSIKIQSTSSSWCKSFANVNSGFFTPDNRLFVFQSKDTLCILQLGTEMCKAFTNVESYAVATDRKDWIVYRHKNENSVVLMNLLTGKEKRFSNLASYSFHKSKKWFTCLSNTLSKDLLVYNLDTDFEEKYSLVKSFIFSTDGNSLLVNAENELRFYNPLEHTFKTIWTSKDSSTVLSSCQFDESGTQVVFTVTDKLPAKLINTIWYYKQGMDKAIIKGNKEILNIPNDLKIGAKASFTDNNNFIHFTLERNGEILQANNNAVQLDVWNYKDLNLQSIQPSLSKQSEIYNGFISIENGNMMIAEFENDKTMDLLQGDFAIVRKSAKKNNRG